MALRLPLRPFPHTARASAPERPALGARTPEQFTHIAERVIGEDVQLGPRQRIFRFELDGRCPREAAVSKAGAVGAGPREQPALRSALPELVEEPS